MSGEKLWVVKLFSTWISFACWILALVLPLRRLSTPGHLLSAVLRMWGGFFVWAVLFCGVVPLTLAWLLRDRRVFEHFPDMPGILAVGMMGWFPALVICMVANLMLIIYRTFRGRR